MTLDPRSFEAADAVPAADLHEAFTAAFSDYLIGPFQVPLSQWPGFVARQAVELSLSRVARDADGRIAAFCLVAPRSATRWRLGTMGAVPSARGGGFAPALLDDFLARAREAGVTIVELEVFAENVRAVKLYEGRGFVKRCDLFGWDRAAGASAARGEVAGIDEVSIDDAFSWLHAVELVIDDLPLQTTPVVLAAARADLVAWRHGLAQIVFAPGADTSKPVVVHSLVDLLGEDDADTLVAALDARFGDRAVRVPAFHRAEVGASAFDRAGYVRQALHQRLMRREPA